VTITDGTVSSVKVNGTQVATSSPCNTAVLPGGSIAINYTSAPSWAWTDAINVSGLIEPPGTDLTLVDSVPGAVPFPAHRAAGQDGLGAALSN
jgi:hypothetical protein